MIPFHDISESSSDSWAIGITDAIISRLTSLRNLAVRPTTSVLKYAKEAPEPVDARHWALKASWKGHTSGPQE